MDGDGETEEAIACPFYTQKGAPLELYPRPCQTLRGMTMLHLGRKTSPDRPLPPRSGVAHIVRRAPTLHIPRL